MQFEYPPPFTTCVQELECGSWVFPAEEGPWLCARRVARVPEGASAAVGAGEAALDAGTREAGAEATEAVMQQ